MTVELYFDMIGRKTAALIAASIESGALLATDDEAVIARYRAFGWALGLAFQLNDDLLGIWGAEQATGKAPSDVAHKKKTLPVIYAYEHAGPEDRQRLGRLYASPHARRPAEVAEIIAILERSGARDVHPRPGPPLPRRGAGRARRGGGRRAVGPGAPRRDHRLGHQRLGCSSRGPAPPEPSGRPRRPPALAPPGRGRPGPCPPAARRSSPRSGSAHRRGPGRQASARRRSGGRSARRPCRTRPSSSSPSSMSKSSARSSTSARPSIRASSSESETMSGSSSSYSSWISPTISSRRSSIVTRPAVPPYSSSTIARWTLRRWNSWSRSSTLIDSGTKTGGRSRVRSAGGSAADLEERQQVLGVQDPDDLVDRLLVDRDPAVALVDDRVDRLAPWSRSAGERDHRDPRHHDLVDALVAELDDRLDHLLLLGLEDPLLAAPLDQDRELLGAHDAPGPDRRRRARAPRWW